MKTKYERYIDYIVNDIEPPYFKNMENEYGVNEKEYQLVLSKIFNQPVSIINGNSVHNSDSKPIYYELPDGSWVIREFDENGFMSYFENSSGNIVGNRR